MATGSAKQRANIGVSAGAQLIPGLASGGRSGRLHLVWLTPAAANSTAIITDGVTSGGVEIANVSAQAPWSNGTDFDIEFQKGLWIVTTGVGCDALVTWE